MKKVTINNITPEAKSHKYIVATLVDGEWWFWGAYNSLENASLGVDCREDRDIFESREVK